jgi:malic enzyme
MSQQTVTAPRTALAPPMSEAVRAVHEGGKLAVTSTANVRDRDDLALVYTPGVAQVCAAIHTQPTLARAPIRATWPERSTPRSTAPTCSSACRPGTRSARPSCG